jgi:hypothetical protein
MWPKEAMGYEAIVKGGKEYRKRISEVIRVNTWTWSILAVPPTIFLMPKLLNTNKGCPATVASAGWNRIWSSYPRKTLKLGSMEISYYYGNIRQKIASGYI